MSDGRSVRWKTILRAHNVGELPPESQDALTAYGVRFTRQVFPGATLPAKATVATIREEDGQHFVDDLEGAVIREGDEEGSG